MSSNIKKKKAKGYVFFGTEFDLTFQDNYSQQLFMDLTELITKDNKGMQKYGIFGGEENLDLLYFIYTAEPENSPESPLMKESYKKLPFYSALFQKENGKKILEKAKIMVGEYLKRTQYKIHLQPKFEHLYEIMKTLISLMKEKDNKHLIALFKVLDVESEEEYNKRVKGDKNYAAVVVYPEIDTEGQKSYVKEVLSLLIKKFDLKSKDLGMNITPRFNKKVDELIYVAGSDGDRKTMPFLNGIFTPHTKYFLLGQEDPTK